MTTDPRMQVIFDALDKAGCQPKWKGTAHIDALCPIFEHNDKRPSLDIDLADNGKVLINCKRNCETGEVLGAIGLGWGDILDQPKDRSKPTVVAKYEYRDEDGKLLYVKERYDPKDFRQYRPLPGGGRSYKLGDVRRVLYRLPKLRADDRKHCYLCEGEKDAERVRDQGEPATTWDTGAWTGKRPKWRSDYTKQLIDAGIQDVFIVRHRDEAGHNTAAYLKLELERAGLNVIIQESIVDIEGADAADHLDADYSLDQLRTVEDDDQPDDQPEQEPEEPSSWQPVDLTPVLSGDWKPPIPTVGLRSDGKHLFYLAKTHTMIGATEVGKDWAALCASADEMKAGHHVVYIDFEDDQGTVVNRLLTLGVSRDLIRTHFHYIRPEHPLIGRHLDTLIEALHDYQPTLVVLVGITEAMSLHGLDPLSNVDISLFDRTVVRQLTRSGAAEVSLDHVIKDPNNRGKYALGGVHKLNIVSGASYTLENREALAIGRKGRSTIKIAKDRHGQVRVHALPGANGMDWFGDLVLDSQAADFAEVWIDPPGGAGGGSDSFRPTILMGKIALELGKAAQPMSQRDLLGLVPGNTDAKRIAFRRLIAEGYVTNKTPHTLLKPFDPEAQP